MKKPMKCATSCDDEQGSWEEELNIVRESEDTLVPVSVFHCMESAQPFQRKLLFHFHLPYPMQIFLSDNCHSGK